MKRTVDSLDADSNGDSNQVFSIYAVKAVYEVENLTSKKYFAKGYAALLDTVGKIIRSLGDGFC